MNKLLFLLCLFGMHGFGVNYAAATVFVENLDMAPKVQVRDKEFLKTIGIIATTKEVNEVNQVTGEKYEAGLWVSLTSFRAPDYEDIYLELLLVDANTKLVLAIENPFVDGENLVSYTVYSGYSLVVTVAMQVSKGAKIEYYRVVFSNI